MTPRETVPRLLLTLVVFEQLFGFDYSESTSDSEFLSLSKLPHPNELDAPKDGIRRDEDILKIESDANPEYLTVLVKRKVDEGCDTNILTTRQLLYPALVKQTLIVNGGNATFLSNNWRDDIVVKRRYVYTLQMSYKSELMMSSSELVPSSNYTMSPRLNYFRVMVDKLWAAQTTLTVAWGNATIEETLEGVFIDPVITENAEDTENKVQYRVHSNGLPHDTYQRGRSEKCGPSFMDPVDDILSTYRELTLRLAVRDAMDRNSAALSAGNIAGMPEVFQTVQCKSYQSRAEYTYSLGILIVAVVISLPGPLATFRLFLPLRELRRDFSMSPLELANALLAGSPPQTEMAGTDSDTIRTVTTTEDEVTDRTPIIMDLATFLAGCNSNVSAEEIVSYIHQCSEEPTVRYGPLDSTNRIGFAILGSEGVPRILNKGGLSVA